MYVFGQILLPQPPVFITDMAPRGALLAFATPTIAARRALTSRATPRSSVAGTATTASMRQRSAARRLLGLNRVAAERPREVRDAAAVAVGEVGIITSVGSAARSVSARQHASRSAICALSTTRIPAKLLPPSAMANVNRATRRSASVAFFSSLRRSLPYCWRWLASVRCTPRHRLPQPRAAACGP